MPAGGGKFGIILFVLFVGVIGGFLVRTAINIESSPHKKAFGWWELYGTMAELKAEDFTPVEAIEIDIGEIKGSVATKSANRFFTAEISLSTPEMVKGFLEFDNSAFSIITLSQMVNNDDSRMQVGRNIIQLDNVGENKYTIIFSDKNGSNVPMKLKLYQNDQLVLEEKVNISN